MKSTEVQTSPMLASGAQLLLPWGPMHVSGTKGYQICNNDVTARLNLEESHQNIFRSISAGEVSLSPVAALARSSIHQLITSMVPLHLPWSQMHSTPYNCLGTLHHICISTFCSDYQIITLANLAFT